MGDMISIQVGIVLLVSDRGAGGLDWQLGRYVKVCQATSVDEAVGPGWGHLPEGFIYLRSVSKCQLRQVIFK